MATLLPSLSSDDEEKNTLQYDSSDDEQEVNDDFVFRDLLVSLSRKEKSREIVVSRGNSYFSYI
jgi:hypothetical protein